MCTGGTANNKMARMSYPVQHTSTNDLPGTLLRVIEIVDISL